MVNNDKIMTRVSVIGTWQDVLEAQRKVKKFVGSGLYVEVTQLSFEQVKENLMTPAICTWFTSRFTPRLVKARSKGGDVDFFAIEVKGPKITTRKALPFFIIQLDEDGVFTPSIPMKREQAERTLKSARGVLSYLCEVKDTCDTRALRK